MLKTQNTMLKRSDRKEKIIYEKIQITITFNQY